MTDPAQQKRNAAPANDKTSLFCHLNKPELQNYRIDKALENFHTIEELEQLTKCSRARINRHIAYIEKNCPHARCEPPNRVSGEKFRFVLEAASSNVIKDGTQPNMQENGYLPCKEDFESAYRTLTRPGDTISIDSVLDQLRINATEKGLSLSSNWRMVTEKNIEVWSTKR